MSNETVSLRLLRGSRARALSGHPWVYANEVQSLLPSALDGSCVQLKTAQGLFLGSGIYNSQSQIVWRQLSSNKIELNEAFFREAIAQSLARRGSTPFCRLVNSEADYLPGLIVDRFQDILVIQAQTKAIELHLETIARVLMELTQARDIVFKNNHPMRKLEGLPLYTRTASGAPIKAQWFSIEGVSYWIDLMEGQKTGFYLDQRLEHLRVGHHAHNRDVLDACCNQGGFALHAAKNGASSVLAIDISKDCIESTRNNAEHNNLNVETLCANIFDYFTQQQADLFDLIILDPPPFAKSKQALAGALRGYKELNLRALKRLRPGGILATYACSHAIDEALFTQVVREAASDAKRSARILAMAEQPQDHPRLLAMPESTYLKGLILEIL